MEKIQTWLDRVYEEKIQKQFDRIVPVVGDEGFGKSTLMLQLTWLWQATRGEEPGVESVLDRVVWNDRTEFKAALASSDPQTAIAVMDAARVLHKREAMHGDQIELEKDLLDVRMNENLILLGFQDWDIIPSMLQERRAKNLLYIPTRGTVWGYSRDTLDERVGADTWPQPDLRDTFPSLDGLELWEQFQERDWEKKQERMFSSDEEDEEDDQPDYKALAERIKEDGIEPVVSIHQGHNKPYIDPDLIEIEYGLRPSDAKKVKKVLAKDSEVVLQHPEEEDATAA